MASCIIAISFVSFTSRPVQSVMSVCKFLADLGVDTDQLAAIRGDLGRKQGKLSSVLIPHCSVIHQKPTELLDIVSPEDQLKDNKTFFFSAHM